MKKNPKTRTFTEYDTACDICGVIITPGPFPRQPCNVCGADMCDKCSVHVVYEEETPRNAQFRFENDWYVCPECNKKYYPSFQAIHQKLYRELREDFNVIEKLEKAQEARQNKLYTRLELAGKELKNLCKQAKEPKKEGALDA